MSMKIRETRNLASQLILGSSGKKKFSAQNIFSHTSSLMKFDQYNEKSWMLKSRWYFWTEYK